ncbi:16436_t:CDS:1, partial [Dentiscutata heterogama]
MAQAVTKVLDKMECNITTMRGIQYNETFVDFLVVFISISTLAIQWIILNLAGLTIRFLQQVRNKSDNSFDLLEINFLNFPELINKWQCVYNYLGPIICAKDQTKIAEMIEVDRHQNRFVRYIQIQQTSISHSITIDKLQQKLIILKKATYITVFAISA